MEKLIIKDSTWHYRFILWYVKGLAKFKRHYYIPDKIYAEDSCEYIKQFTRALFGTIWFTICAAYLSFSITFNVTLFTLIAWNMPKFNLNLIFKTFEMISPSEILTFSFGIFVTAIIALIILSILGLAVIGFLKIAQYFFIFKDRVEETNKFFKMVKANSDRICIPIQIQRTNK